MRLAVPYSPEAYARLHAAIDAAGAPRSAGTKPPMFELPELGPGRWHIRSVDVKVFWFGGVGHIGVDVVRFAPPSPLALR